MLLLTVFAFLAGVVTILSPCILPILPVILSGSVAEGRRKPIGIVAGFVMSFTFFTLFLATIVKATGISADALRSFSVIVILVFGLSLLSSRMQLAIEQLFVKLSRFTPKTQQSSGFIGGIVIGVSLGLIWTPCVGPILASVITLAISGTVTGSAAIITFAYAIGTAIPMLAVIYGGQSLMKKVPWLLNNTTNIQKVFGILMIFTAAAIYLNVDRNFQAFVLERIPQYSESITTLEDIPIVKDRLDILQNR